MIPAGVADGAVVGGQGGDRGVGVEPTGIGDDPQVGVGDALVLTAERRLRAGECITVGRDPRHGDDPRSTFDDQVDEAVRTGP